MTTTDRSSAEIIGRILPLTLGHRDGHRILDLANDLAAAVRDETLTEAHDLVQDVLPCLVGCDCAGQRAATALLAARTGLEG